MAILENAAAQGHAYAMFSLGEMYLTRKERGQAAQAVHWFTKGAEAGLPDAMFNLAQCLDEAGEDHPAAAGWYKRAADAGDEWAANNLSNMYAVGRGRASGPGR